MVQPAADSQEDSSRFAARARAGRAWILAAALLWSSSGLFAKAPLFADWTPDTRGPLLAFWRALFAGLLVLTAVRRPRWSLKLVPMTLAFAVMNVSYLTAMSLTTAANAIWLQSTAPWCVLLLGLIFWREIPSRADLLALVPAGCGVALILWHELQGQAQFGIVSGLVSGVAYAGVVIGLRSLRAEDSAWLVAVNHLVTAALVFPYVAYLNVWPRAEQLPVLAAFGIFQMGLPYLMFARGLRTVSSQEASGIALIEPLLLPVWVYLAWGEQPAWWTIAGGLLILIGLVLRYAAPLVYGRRASGELILPPLD